MAPRTMAGFLAMAAKKAREDKGRRPYHVAAQLDGDPSTVYRFEKGRWPRDADALIDAYARDLDIDSLDIWLAAVQLWKDDVAGATKPRARRAAVAAGQQGAQRQRSRQSEDPGVDESPRKSARGD